MPHPLENRAQLLAAKLKHRIEIERDAMLDENGRRPFVKQLTRAQALEFWQKHRYDALGQQVLAGLSPEQQQELDLVLAREGGYGTL